MATPSTSRSMQVSCRHTGPVPIYYRFGLCPEECNKWEGHRRSSRYPAIAVCDLDFADDVVLISNKIGQARKLIQSVQGECRRVELELNDKKTKSMFFNTNTESIVTIEGTVINHALTETGEQDFKYLGSRCNQDRDKPLAKLSHGSHSIN